MNEETCLSNQKKERQSNLELFRIITMLIIVAHHYVVNSGLVEMVESAETLRGNDIFLLLFGWGGKTGINCFVLITGFFMCTSKISVRKFLKLLGEVYFYNVLFFAIFTLTGYAPFSSEDFWYAIFPFFYVSDGFTTCFLLFYLFIPFLNILLNGMTEKQHAALVGLCLFIYTIISSVPKLGGNVDFNYVTWFTVLYFLSSYIRLYPKEIYNNTKLWGWLSLGSVLLSWASMIVIAFFDRLLGKDYSVYFFVADSNKILAVVTALCAFMFFKNVKIKQSRWINTCAASTFGVLQIHANSDVMRQWLWRDVLDNVSYYQSEWLVVHACCAVVGVYVLCTIIDQIRIMIIEKPLFRWLDAKRP